MRRVSPVSEPHYCLPIKLQRHYSVRSEHGGSPFSEGDSLKGMRRGNGLHFLRKQMFCCANFHPLLPTLTFIFIAIYHLAYTPTDYLLKIRINIALLITYIFLGCSSVIPTPLDRYIWCFLAFDGPGFGQPWRDCSALTPSSGWTSALLYLHFSSMKLLLTWRSASLSFELMKFEV